MDVLVGGLLMMGMVLGFVLGLTQWTLGPLMAAARQTPSPTRFLLSDLWWLMIQLQFAMALIAWAVPEDLPTSSRVAAMLWLGLPVAAFWYLCLHAISQAGIRGTLRRGVACVLLLPGTVAAIVVLPMLMSAIPSLLGSRAPTAPDELGRVISWLAAIALAAASLRWVARWTLPAGGLLATSAPPVTSSPRRIRPPESNPAYSPRQSSRRRGGRRPYSADGPK